jgi:hypothetical protein
MADLVHQSLRNEYNYLDRASQLLFNRIQQLCMEVRIQPSPLWWCQTHLCRY